MRPHSVAAATRCLRHWPPDRPNDGDGSPPTARSPVQIPVNERTAGDTRANAVSNVGVLVAPVPVTKDLRELRAAIKHALIRHRKARDQEHAMLSIAPLLPKRLILVGSGTNVASSNLGTFNPAAGRPDGTGADYLVTHVVYPGMTKSLMHWIGGLQLLVSGKVLRQVFLSVLAYQPGCRNSKDALGRHLSTALNDFLLADTHLSAPESSASLMITD